MRLRRCPGGVTVSKLSRHVRGQGSIPVSGLRFLFIFVLFTVCLPLFLDC